MDARNKLMKRYKKGFTLRMVLFVLGMVWTYSAFAIYAEGSNDLSTTLVLIVIFLTFLVSFERVCLDKERRAYWVFGLLLNLPGLLLAFTVYWLRCKSKLKRKSEMRHHKLS